MGNDWEAVKGSRYALQAATLGVGHPRAVFGILSHYTIAYMFCLTVALAERNDSTHGSSLFASFASTASSLCSEVEVADASLQVDLSKESLTDAIKSPDESEIALSPLPTPFVPYLQPGSPPSLFSPKPSALPQRLLVLPKPSSAPAFVVPLHSTPIAPPPPSHSAISPKVCEFCRF
jgi:hypothetical protein